MPCCSVCTQQATRAIASGHHGSCSEPDRCQSCREDVDDHTLLFIHNRGEVIVPPCALAVKIVFFIPMDEFMRSNVELEIFYHQIYHHQCLQQIVQLLLLMSITKVLMTSMTKKAKCIGSD